MLDPEKRAVAADVVADVLPLAMVKLALVLAAAFVVNIPDVVKLLLTFTCFPKVNWGDVPTKSSVTLPVLPTVVLK